MSVVVLDWYLLQLGYPVSSETQHIQLLAVIQTFYLADVVMVERKVLQIRQCFQSTNFPNVVE